MEDAYDGLERWIRPTGVQQADLGNAALELHSASPIPAVQL
jgi:hypothetical protein